jgi:protein-S-isoprenylcysteine O-methyltransferase Ste14
MSLKSKWIEFLYTSATNTKKIRTILTPVGAIIFGLFLFFFVFIAIQCDNFFQLPRMFTFPLNLYLSIPLILLGLLLTGWSVIYFLKVKGTPVPVNPPLKLVNTGPYTYTRNPMLTGIFLILFGIGFLIGSISLIFIYTPLFILLNTWELKMIEEPELSKRLGEQYDDYRNRTPMFIPGTKTKFKRNI